MLASEMVQTPVIRGYVRNGRIVVDEPTDLPEGTEVELVVIRVILPNDEVIEGEAMEELLGRGATR